MRRLASLALACLALSASPLFAYEISSSAIVNNDGSLRIKGKTVYLYGIHIPETNRTCKTYRVPPSCGSRAAVALDFKIDGFVRCEIKSRQEDGSVITWELESSPTAMLRKGGLTKAKIMGDGQPVVARVQPARPEAGTPYRAYTTRITYADGHYYVLSAE